MVYIPVKISSESDNLPVYTFFAGTVGALILGISIGVFMSVRVALPPSTNVRNEVGSVGAIGNGALLEKNTKDTTVLANDAVVDTPQGDVLGVSDTIDDASGVAVDVNAPTKAEALESIRATIDVQTTLSDRFANDIERVKNDSLLLIRDFDQNCGNWKDDCAIPFASALEINNSSYEYLAERLNTVTSDLDAARNAESILLSE